MRAETRFYTGRSRFIPVLSLILIICLLGGCSSQKATTVDMADLQSAMLAADCSLPAMTCVNGETEGADELFTYLSDLTYDKVSDFFLSYSTEGKADEVAVITLKNASDVDLAQKSLETHVKKRLQLFQQYSPDQAELIEEAAVFTSENYAVLIICDDVNAVKTAFTDFLSKAQKEQ